MCRGFFAPPEFTGKRCCFGLFELLVGARIAASIIISMAVAHLIGAWHLISGNENEAAEEGQKTAVTIVFVLVVASAAFVFIGIQTKISDFLYPFFVCMLLAGTASVFTALFPFVFLIERRHKEPAIHVLVLIIVVYTAISILCGWFTCITCQAIDCIMIEKRGGGPCGNRNSSAVQSEINRLKKELREAKSEKRTLKRNARSAGKTSTGIQVNSMEMQPCSSNSSGNKQLGSLPPAYDEVVELNDLP